MKSDAYSAFMLDHAAGSLSPEMAIAAQLHALLSATGREQDAIWQSCGRVFGRGGPDRAAQAGGCLPEALELARADYLAVPWKRGLSGVHYARRGKDRGKLMRLDPGQSAPEHSHSALEATGVLKGAFGDGHGVYHRGDLVLGRPGVNHRPSAVGTDACICYGAQEALPFWRFS